MGKFMQWMRHELEGIKAAEIKPIDREVQDGDEVLGTLADPDLQKLLALRDRLDSQLVALVKEHAHKIIEVVGVESKLDHDPKTCEHCTMVREAATLIDKMNAVNALFWTGLRHELSEDALLKLHKAGNTIGIRRGWKIVACRESKLSTLAALLALGLPIPTPV